MTPRDAPAQAGASPRPEIDTEERRATGRIGRMRYRFGPFTMDLDRYELRRDAERLEIQPKGFDVLRYLLENAERTVPKQELLDELWQGVVVGEAALTTAVRQARRALGEQERDAGILQTLRRRGYRIGVPVALENEAPPEPPAEEARTVEPVAVTENAEPPATPPPRPAEPERRQLTVLVCDMADSTELSASLDPEDWSEISRGFLGACGETVESFDGHIAQYLGDGLLVYFGWPRAHEDDAERAVRAGLAITATIEARNDAVEKSHGVRLRVRVGIHTGLVIVGDVGGASRKETLAQGVTTSVAARLQSEAEPGTVVLSAATLRLVSGIFVTRDVGERALDGAGSMHVFHALQPSGVRSRLDVNAARGLTPLIGRERELGLLEDRFAHVCDGNGQVVLVSGEAGIGKSRLLREFQERLTPRPHTWLECRGSPHTRQSAFFPILELQQQGLGLRRNASADESIAALEAGLAGAGFELDDAVPLMATFHGLEVPARYEEPALTPEGLRRKTLDLLAEWLLRLGRLQPVALVVEDLHWVDASTLELLGLILTRVPREQVLLLATHRPEFEAPWASKSHVTPLMLSRLTGEQLRDLVRKSVYGRSVPDAWVDRIAGRADGVPLFAEELTRAIIESNPDSSAPVEGAGVPIPETLQDSLTGRLDALGPAKELAQLGAVLGREFSYELLLEVSGWNAERIDAGLEAALREEIFYQRGARPEATYLFKHALIRDAAYQSLVRATRQRLHAQAADAIAKRRPDLAEANPELIAQHLAEGNEPARALTLYRHAGEIAALRSANEEAIAHLMRAMQLLRAMPEGKARDAEELGICTALAPPLLAARGYGDNELRRVSERARSLCKTAGDVAQLANALGGLYSFHLVRAELGTARELADEALELAGRPGARELLPSAHAWAGTELFWRGEWARTAPHFDTAVALHSPAPSEIRFVQHPAALARILRAWTAWPLGFPDQALEQSEEAIAYARSIGDPFSLAHALSFTAWVLILRGEPEGVIERTEEALELAEEQCFPIWHGVAKAYRGWAVTHGQPGQDAVDEILDGIKETATTGTLVGLSFLQALLAEAHGTMGREEAVRTCLDSAFEWSQHLGDPFWLAELHRLNGESMLRASEGREADAQREFERAAEIARDQEATSLELRAATSLARLWRRRGQQGAARELLRPLYDRFDQGLDTSDLLLARTLLIELGG